MDSSLRTLEADKTEKAEKVGELLAQRAKEAGITRSCSTAVATATRAASRPWRTAPAKAGWSSDARPGIAIKTATEMRNH